MKSIFYIFYILIIICNSSDSSNTNNSLAYSKNDLDIIIRPAQESDIPEIIVLDHRVSYEYFKPLYVNAYSHLPLGKNPDYFLNLELEDEKKTIYDYIIQSQTGRILIAYDTAKSKPVGLIIFHKFNNNSLEIELLLIDRNYRGLHLGTLLVNQALSTFEDITSCTVYPFKLGNAKVLNFYESLGFIHKGAAPQERKTIFNISYYDLYFYYKKDL